MGLVLEAATGHVEVMAVGADGTELALEAEEVGHPGGVAVPPPLVVEVGHRLAPRQRGGHRGAHRGVPLLLGAEPGADRAAHQHHRVIGQAGGDLVGVVAGGDGHVGPGGAEPGLGPALVAAEADDGHPGGRAAGQPGDGPRGHAAQGRLVAGAGLARSRAHRAERRDRLPRKGDLTRVDSHL